MKKMTLLSTFTLLSLNAFSFDSQPELEYRMKHRRKIANVEKRKSYHLSQTQLENQNEVEDVASHRSGISILLGGVTGSTTKDASSYDATTNVIKKYPDSKTKLNWKEIGVKFGYLPYQELGANVKLYFADGAYTEKANIAFTNVRAEANAAVLVHPNVSLSAGLNISKYKFTTSSVSSIKFNTKLGYQAGAELYVLKNLSFALDYLRLANDYTIPGDEVISGKIHTNVLKLNMGINF